MNRQRPQFHHDHRSTSHRRAVVAGVVLALALVVAVEIFSAIVHPTPPDFRGTHEEMCLHVARFPHWVLAAVVPMWGFAAFISTWLAGRLGNRGLALAVALLLLAAAIFNIAMLPYALWFKIVMPLAIAVAVVYGMSYRHVANQQRLMARNNHEDCRVGEGQCELSPLPSSNRTCGFPASGFPGETHQ